MNRHIEENLEACLQGSLDAARLAEFERVLAAENDDTRNAVTRMRVQSRLMQTALRPEPGAEPAPGFYARVMERIEAQRAGSSFWSAFLEPLFFRRLVMASATLLMLLGLTLFTSGVDDVAVAGDSAAPHVIMAGEPQPLDVTTVSEGAPEGRDRVLVDLTTHQE